MPASVQCPSCQRKLNVQSQLQGKSVRCPACKSSFVVEFDPGEDPGIPFHDDTESNPASAAPQAAPSPYDQLAANLLTDGLLKPAGGTAATAKSSTPSPSPYESTATTQAFAANPLTPKHNVADSESGGTMPGFVRIGIFLMVLAVLSLVLPLVGLQVKGLHRMGDGAYVAGMVLGAIGGVVIGIGYLLRSDFVMSMMFGAFPTCIFIGLAIGINAFLSESSEPSTVSTTSTGSELRGPSKRLSSQSPFSNNRTPSNNRPFTGSGASNTTTGSSGPIGAKGSQPTTRPSQPPAPFVPSPEPTETAFEKARRKIEFNAKELSSNAPGNPFVDANRLNQMSDQLEGQLTELRKKAESEQAKHREKFGSNSGSQMASDFSERLKRKVDINRRRSEMTSALGIGFDDFKPEMLTKVAGTVSSFKTYLAHVDRRPMIGIDFALQTSGGDTISTMIPVYSESENHMMLSKEGYAIAGLNVHVEDQLLAIQPIYMKVDGSKFDPNDSYLGEWVGEEPSPEKITKLAGDGRPVFGIYISGMSDVASIALIVDPKK